MLSQDDAGKVVYASSFSKTVCPGIRVGYLVGPAAIIKQIQGIATNTYISPNMVAQSIVNQFARSGRMDGAIATVKNALRDRRDALVAALERELPEARFTPPSGGYFMWVELPEEVDVAELEPAAKERGVVFVKGTDFLLEGGAQHAAPRVLRRDAGGDRHGHHAPRRGRAQPGVDEREHGGSLTAASGLVRTRRGPVSRHRVSPPETHAYGPDASQFCELFRPAGPPAWRSCSTAASGARATTAR